MFFIQKEEKFLNIGLDIVYEAIVAEASLTKDIVSGAIKADPYLRTEIVTHATATTLAINPDKPMFLEILTAANEASTDRMPRAHRP